MSDLYPNLTRESLRVIVLARPGEIITPELVAMAWATFGQKAQDNQTG